LFMAGWKPFPFQKSIESESGKGQTKKESSCHN